MSWAARSCGHGHAAIAATVSAVSAELENVRAATCALKNDIREHKS